MLPVDSPEFGTRKPGVSYVPRPGSYAIVFDTDGRVALLETPRGHYLPGGGIDFGESPLQALVREVSEECGFILADLNASGSRSLKCVSESCGDKSSRSISPTADRSSPLSGQEGLGVGSCLKPIGWAVEYVHTDGHDYGIRKECVFFSAVVADDSGSATEPDHTLVWLTPEEAIKVMAHRSQAWAIKQCLLTVGRIIAPFV